MLISFSVENWMSFRDKTTLCMLASEESKHIATVPSIENHEINILPIAIIYGGNASGKTNLFKALNFVKKMVVVGTSPDDYIGVEPFRLDKVTESNPVRFKLEVLVNEILYELCFSFNHKCVVEETLFESKEKNHKVLLYTRNSDVIKLEKASYSEDDEQSFLEYVKKGTRDNQLFITNTIFQNSQRFRPIYDWLKNDLILIGSNRVIDIAQEFCHLEKKDSNKVYFIDEFDRSLHHLLTRNLIQSYLKSCTRESRSQLIVNSHDLLMLDTNLFRSDEIWFSERDNNGVSRLASLIEYKEISSSKNLMQRYLQGRFGGVPNLIEEWIRSDDI